MTKKIILSLMIILIMITGCTTGNDDSRRPVLVQGAMDVEVETMADALENKKEVTLGKYKYYEGLIDGYPVIVAKTNIGIANAAVSTTLAIEHYNPIIIINQGTAGGHDPALHKFDVVIAEHGFNMGAFKSDFQDNGEGVDPTALIMRNMETLPNGKGEEVEMFDFPSDKDLMTLAYGIKNKYTHGEVVYGTIGTADEWNNQLDRIKFLHDKFNTSVEEMESQSVAQMAYNYNIPFLGIRVLSNTAIHDESFDHQSAIYLQEYVLEIIKEYITTTK